MNIALGGSAGLPEQEMDASGYKDATNIHEKAPPQSESEAEQPTELHNLGHLFPEDSARNSMAEVLNKR